MGNKLLGILGGLGPMAGIYFCELLTSHTKAERDSDHLSFIMSSKADTPDRSSYILGRSKDDPAPVMASEALRLQNAGAELLAIPCNTAHHFYDEVCRAVDIPILNIIEQTARFCESRGIKKVGVLATEGTAASGAYPYYMSRRGIEVIPLTESEQNIISDIIFKEIKCGKKPDLESFCGVCDSLLKRGCEAVILGCTELSLIKKEFALEDNIIDSLELLALAAIVECGKTPVGFDGALMDFYGNAGKG